MGYGGCIIKRSSDIRNYRKVMIGIEFMYVGKNR